jgi:predicted TIM-barrel fold metal-dependent hydrolase
MSIENLTIEYHSARDSLNLFDADCWTGTPAKSDFCVMNNLSETRQTMERYQVKKAIISHTLSRDYDSLVGNRLLLEEIAENDFFWGAAVLVPSALPKLDFPNYLKQLISHKIVMIRLFPKLHNFLLSEWYASNFLAALSEHKMPVMIENSQISWDMVNTLCSNYPQLPVIIKGGERKLFYDNRIYYRLLEKYANFYLQMHNLINYLELDDIVKNFGAQRLLFGSCFPYLDPNAAIMLITHGDFSRDDKEMIAHKNLENLIEGIAN